MCPEPEHVEVPLPPDDDAVVELEHSEFERSDQEDDEWPDGPDRAESAE